MVLEVAILDVVPEQTAAFQQAFHQAQPLIASAKGYLGHELRRCVETPSRFILLVKWETLEDHTEGFRGSNAYEEWKQLLHAFYDPFPRVEHYEALFQQAAR